MPDDRGEMLFGADYYPEHRDPSKWDYDLDNMAGAFVNTLRVGEFAWTRFEPRDGEYDFSWMDTFSSKASERGIRLLLCPPLRTAPAWLVEKDPSILLEREDGVRLEYGSRYTFCINHPLLREKGQALAEAMASHYGHNENIVGWHLDNEHGDEPDCHCPICRAKFQQWCEERYGSIDRLNKRWGLAFWSLEYDHFGQVPTPRVTKTLIHGSVGHLLAWRRYRSDCTVEAVELQASALRRHIMEEQFVTTNFNGAWLNRTDLYDLAGHLDIAGRNYMPSYGDGERFNAWELATCRGYKQQNFQIHELLSGGYMIPGNPRNTPAPGELERLTMHCIANGADATLYFRWRACPFGNEQAYGTITDYDGRPKRVYAEVKRVGQNLARLSPLLEGTSVSSDVGLLYDFPTRWVMETGEWWLSPKELNELYVEHSRKLYNTLHLQGRSCDVIGTCSGLSQYRLLIVPALGPVDDSLADKLVGYVKGGGTLVWHPLSGIKDADANIYPDRLHSGLRDLLGVDIREFATAAGGVPIPFTWTGRRYNGSLFCDLPVLRGAESRGEFVDSWYAGTTAVAEREVGKGRIIYVMTYAEDKFYADFFNELCKQLGIRRILDADVPESIEIAERVAPDGRRLMFLLNSRDEEQTILLPQAMRGVHDAYNEEDIADTVTMKPFGVRILQFCS